MYSTINTATAAAVAASILLSFADPIVAFSPSLVRASPALRIAPAVARPLSLGRLQIVDARKSPRRPISSTQMAIGAGAGELLVLAQTAKLLAYAPIVAYAWYMAALAKNALIVDAITAAILYAFGKWTSVKILRKRESNMARFLGIWSLLGVADGVCTHWWYSFLQRVADGAGTSKLIEALGMTATSSFIYSPIYCAGFLLLLSLLEGKGCKGAKYRVQHDVKELYWKTFKVWGPTNLLLFAFVPLHVRTVVSMGIHYVFLVGLALWDAKVRESREDFAASAAGPEMAVQWDQPVYTNSMQGLRFATAFKAVDDQLERLPRVTEA